MRSLSLLLYLLLVLVILLTSQQAWAFDPKDHRFITLDALGAIRFGEYTVKGRRFIDSTAAKQIAEANVKTDRHISNLFAAPELHFDNEKFIESSLLLLKLKKEVINKLLVCKRHEARRSLGRALHTLQDFYAHTNWVETQSGINIALGRGLYNPTVAPRPCPNNFDTLEGDGLTAMTSGYFFFEPSFSSNFGICNFIPLQAGKCAHGANYRADTAHCGGIAKDSVLPGDEGIKEGAIRMAHAATIDFVQQISNELAVFDPPDLFDALRLQPGQAPCKRRIPMPD